MECGKLEDLSVYLSSRYRAQGHNSTRRTIPASPDAGGYGGTIDVFPESLPTGSTPLSSAALNGAGTSRCPRPSSWGGLKGYVSKVESRRREHQSLPAALVGCTRQECIVYEILPQSSVWRMQMRDADADWGDLWRSSVSRRWRYVCIVCIAGRLVAFVTNDNLGGLRVQRLALTYTTDNAEATRARSITQGPVV